MSDLTMKNSLDDCLQLASELIACPSLTPDDAGCQAIISKRLQALGFKVTELPFGDVKNLWAEYGTEGPLLVFAGHTDVVPPGLLNQWQSPPFIATVRDQKLFGRGAADMKSSLAAMVIAVTRYLKKTKDFKGRIGFLITSDEEGVAHDGTQKVVAWLKERAIKIDYCVVGEATCEKDFGDTIKIGRRGSLSGRLTIHGKQGHIAYPQLADNPIHRAMPALLALTNMQLDNGDDYFPATSFQFSNIHAGTGANNVIPGELILDFNLRYSPQHTHLQLQAMIENILNDHKLRYSLDWQHSASPFLTKPARLTKMLSSAIESISKVTPTLSTSGGTSDGRFICTLGCEVVEFGPKNASIHQVDEHIDLEDLRQLPVVYEKLLALVFS